MRIWIILIIFMMGCGMGSRTYHTVDRVNGDHREVIYIDDRFSLEDIEEIKKGISSWEWGMNGNIEFIIERYHIGERADGIIITKVRSIDNIKESDYGLVLAYCDIIGGRVIYLIRDRIGISDIKYIIRHEFGHIMGAYHMEDGLMYKIYDRDKYDCIDYGTMLQVSMYRMIDIRKLNYCL